MLRIALACVAGLAVLYLIGLPYMYFVLAGKWSIQKTIVSGCLIFLPFDALKIVVTTLLCVRLLRVVAAWRIQLRAHAAVAQEFHEPLAGRAR